MSSLNDRTARDVARDLLRNQTTQFRLGDSWVTANVCRRPDENGVLQNSVCIGDAHNFVPEFDDRYLTDRDYQERVRAAQEIRFQYQNLSNKPRAPTSVTTTIPMPEAPQEKIIIQHKYYGMGIGGVSLIIFVLGFLCGGSATFETRIIDGLRYLGFWYIIICYAALIGFLFFCLIIPGVWVLWTDTGFVYNYILDLLQIAQNDITDVLLGVVLSIGVLFGLILLGAFLIKLVNSK